MPKIGSKLWIILSLIFLMLVFGANSVFATGPGCTDISGQTQTLTPPDSAFILFDSLGGIPSETYEACIIDNPDDTFIFVDTYTPNGIELYPILNYAWNENAGWLQFDWKVGGTSFSQYQAAADITGYLYGYVWSENIGWIQLDWWRTDSVNYPLGKKTPGVPRIDFESGKPYTITGYAWNDSLGWLNLSGAKTNWRPPIAIKIDKTPHELDIPEKAVCKNLYTVPYLKAEVDFAAPSPTPLTINLVSRPSNVAPTEFRYRANVPGSKIDGFDIGAPFGEYSKDKSSSSYTWTENNPHTITVNLNPTQDPLCVAQIAVVEPFKYTCNGAPINYLPECEISKPGAAVYCENNCLFKVRPTPEPSPTPPIEFCGNRKQESGEDCDQGFYGGYNNDLSYCSSDCKKIAKPQVIPEQLTQQYPWYPEAPFQALENIMPANPATHSYDTCFCLLDKNGNCLQAKDPVTDMKVTIDLENTVIFDQGLENTRVAKCEGKITDRDCGDDLPAPTQENPADLKAIYQAKYDNKTPNKDYYGEAAIVEIYAKTNPNNKMYAQAFDDKGNYNASIILPAKTNPTEDDAKVCVKVKSYMPTSGANAYDENHNGAIDPQDHFYDDGETSLYRIRLNKVTYNLGGVDQEVSYNFEKDDGYFHFRSPLELTRLDTVDGKDFILAIADQVSRFLAYATRVVPEQSSLTHVPTLDKAKIKIGVDRIDIGSIFWIDLDVLETNLKLDSSTAAKLDQRSASYSTPRTPEVLDDSFEIAAGKLLNINENDTDVECNWGEYCSIFLKPFYQSDSARAQKITEGRDVQLYSEISFVVPSLQVVDATTGLIKNVSGKTLRYLSNQFPRGKESAIGNPLADIRGTISSSTGVYTRREGQVVVTVGNLSTNAIRNTINANVNEIIRSSTLQNQNRSGVTPVEVESKNGIYSVSGGKFEWLLNKKVVYTKEDVIIDSLATTKTSLNGKEQNTTFVVEGGNIFIDGNIDVEEARIGLIALKKCKNNICTGGNIYIAPDVTDLYVNMFADGSIFSYDGNRGNIDNKGVPKISDGQRTSFFSGNQLLIKGSISSQNTVGGSVGDKGVYVLGDGTPTSKQAEAVPYDLNHLRYQKLEKTGGGSYAPVINKRAKGLPDTVSQNESIYVIYQAPASDLPGFQIEKGIGSGGQINR